MNLEDATAGRRAVTFLRFPVQIRRRSGRILIVFAMAALVAAGWCEGTTSWVEARLLSRYDRNLRFVVSSGPSPAIAFPRSGPYDTNFGYRFIPVFARRLAPEGFDIAAQARMSPTMLSVVRMGLYPPYREKDQAGLVLRDSRGAVFYEARFPDSVYRTFQSVPPVLANTLAYIEDRHLLDLHPATRNPAVSWGRFTRALFDQARHLFEPEAPTPGGSTLATQIEKFRHSPGGYTANGAEKLRQMASASLWAYLGGPDTTAARQRIVVDYLNTVPMSARAGVGSIHGLRDGLRVWYGRDPRDIDALLQTPQAALPARALAYKQALSLMIAQRAPTYYLLRDPQALDRLTNRYLVRLGTSGIIRPALEYAALGQVLRIAPTQNAPPPPPFVAQKAATATRVRLAQLLAIRDSYVLDHLDLSARTTIDASTQRAVTMRLRAVTTRQGAAAADLFGHDMLLPGSDPAHIRFAFTMYEHVGGANLLRVQTDSGDRPFDLNQGARLNLGSTAKLRTVILYLQIVTRLHDRYAGLDSAALRRVVVAPQDPIKSWALAYLETARDRSLKPMLQAALHRTYSGNPQEAFFTGGGLQRFSNFDPVDDHAMHTVAEGFQHSINLVFVRLMRDIVRYEMDRSPDLAAKVMRNPTLRIAYLKRFAESEGALFVARFYRNEVGRTPESMELALLDRAPGQPFRKAAAILAIEPQASLQRFADLLHASLPGAELDDALVVDLYRRYAPQRFGLADRGFLARVHPLELWVVSYLVSHPGATLQQAVRDSLEPRVQVYAWLFRTHDRARQDMRIRLVLEAEAYRRIAMAWRRLGYPFESVTPSYACALGASGDRPAALSELIGILLDRGVRYPPRQIEALDFASGTPYATRFVAQPTHGMRVLPSAIADVLRPVLASVVEGGTGVRLRGAYHLPNGEPIAVGGKTGTGDQRYAVYSRSGALLASRRVNRTATFVFFLGNRFFGTITAYVHEPFAARYRFTSAMSVQLLRDLAPDLMPLIADPDRKMPEI
ncbi:putative membrane carboxypeptidase (Penicillin-binding) transmembrane protein [Burkholderiales bacterium GJ-E10]|nr:putative membrane carboxypeptidase (Penicillin-binding) transmembrane protein [Burkholderiales bacterium GJ-E10]